MYIGCFCLLLRTLHLLLNSLVKQRENGIGELTVWQHSLMALGNRAAELSTGSCALPAQLFPHLVDPSRKSACHPFGSHVCLVMLHLGSASGLAGRHAIGTSLDPKA